jgi:putative NADPH-quinone reductase
MSLRLNQSPEKFKEFYGRNVEQMPKLIAEGRVPLSVSGLMQRRLDIRNASDDVKSSWIDSYFDTGDAVVYHPDGRVKIVLDSQTLREMSPDSKRNAGALVLTPEQYDAMNGEEFKKGKLGKVNEGMSEADVKAHPVWKVLARDPALLNDYVDYIFAEGKKRFGYDTSMGVYPSSVKGNTPEMRAWFVYRFEGRSSVYGWGGLDYDYGRLVGVAPEAQNAKIPGVGNVKNYTMADVQSAVSELEALERLVKPEALGRVRSLVRKL